MAAGDAVLYMAARDTVRVLYMTLGDAASNEKDTLLLEVVRDI